MVHRPGPGRTYAGDVTSGHVLTPLVRLQASEADRLTRLPEVVVHELRALVLFKLWVPQRYDGSELALTATLRIYEAAVLLDSEFGRAWRDLQTLAAHVSVSPLRT